MRTRTETALRLSVLLVIIVAVAVPALAQPAARVVTEYYHLDALGSVRLITNEQGQVVREIDYQPFGEEVVPPTTPQTNTRLFTGQQRDRETGLDYFGARYYRPDLGRFTTVDPALNVNEALLDPQRWNRYAYVRNNPLKYVDQDGRWPTRVVDVHRQIFALALPRLSKAQLDLMAAGSYWADDAQDTLARAHAMSDPGQRAAAEGLYRAWVRDYETDARTWNSLWHFGVAGHAIQDSFSPPHRGFQEWNGYGLDTPGHLYDERSLSVLTPRELQDMLQGVWDAYYETFGGPAFTAATGVLYSRPINAGVLTLAPTVF